MTLWASAPGVVDVPAVRAQQVTYTSADGTTVRMFVLASAHAVDDEGRPDRPRPTILYGYGGFGLSLTPGVLGDACSPGSRPAGCTRSRTCAAAARRARTGTAPGCSATSRTSSTTSTPPPGGWSTAGGRRRSSCRASGGSNGGLLVGAALTQRPDLFAAVVCSAPLLDMVRYEHFGLGATWNVEYGSAAVPEELAWLLAYSPYHAAEPTAGVPRRAVHGVRRRHPRRPDARTQDVRGAAARDHVRHGRSCCARRTDVGHGARAVTRSVDLSADALAFTAAYTGLEPPAA